MAASSSTRFVSLGEEELDKIIDEKDSSSTKKVISVAENVLKAYRSLQKQVHLVSFFVHFMPG